MYHFNFYLPERQMQRLRSVSSQTDLSVSELMRLMFEHGLQPKVLNRLLPTCSGQIVLETGRG